MENNIDDQVFQGKDNKSADSKLEKENNIEEEEDARAFLRERFLRTLFSIYNKPASFSMHERTQVQALFRATDIDMENFQVSDLQTPMGVVPEALLRSSDVLSFKMEFGDKAERRRIFARKCRRLRQNPDCQSDFPGLKAKLDKTRIVIQSRKTKRNKKPSKIPTATSRHNRETQSDSSADESKRKSNIQQKPDSGISFQSDQREQSGNVFKKAVRKVLRSVTPTRQKKMACEPSTIEVKMTTSVKAKNTPSSHMQSETVQNIKNSQKPAPRDTKTSFLRKKLQSERKLSTKKTKSGDVATRSTADQRDLNMEDQKQSDSEFSVDLVQEYVLCDQEELKNVKETSSYRPKRTLEGLTNRGEETRKCRDAVEELDEEWAESDLVKPLPVDIDVISLNHGNNGYDTDDDMNNKESPRDQNDLLMSLEDIKVSGETVPKEKTVVGRREDATSPRDTCPIMETFLQKRRQMFANHSAKAIEEEDEDSPSDWANSGFSTEDDEGDSFQPKRNNEVLTTGSNAVKKGAKTDQYRKNKSSQGAAPLEAPHSGRQTEARKDLGINYGEIYDDWDDSSSEPSQTLSVKKETCSNSKDNEVLPSTCDMDSLHGQGANEVVEEGHIRTNEAVYAHIQANGSERYDDWDDSSSESIQNLKPFLNPTAKKIGSVSNGDQGLPTANNVGLLGICAVDEAVKEEQVNDEQCQANIPERFDDWDDSSSESLQTPSLDLSGEDETVFHSKEINGLPATCNVGASPEGEEADEQQARTNQLDREQILAKCPERNDDWDKSFSESVRKPLFDPLAEKKTGSPSNRKQVPTTTTCEILSVTCTADETTEGEQADHENVQTNPLPQRYDDWDDSSSEPVQTPAINLSEEENNEFHASKSQMPHSTWNVTSLNACAIDDVPKDEQARTQRNAKELVQTNDSERYDAYDSGDSSKESVRSLAVDLCREETGSNISRYQIAPRLCNEDSFNACAIDAVAGNEEAQTNLTVADIEQIQTNRPEGYDQQAQTNIPECYDDWDDSASESVRTPSLDVSGEETGCHMKRQMLSTVCNAGPTDARTAEEASDDEKAHSIRADDKEAKTNCVEHYHELDNSKCESVRTLSLELSGEKNNGLVNKDVVIPSTCNQGSSHSYTTNYTQDDKQAEIKHRELFVESDDSSSNSAGTARSDTDISFFGDRENSAAIINDNQMQPPTYSAGSLDARVAENETDCGQLEIRKHRELEPAVKHTDLKRSPNKEGQNRSEQVAASSLNQGPQHAYVPRTEQTNSLVDQNIFENSAERRKAHISGALLPRKHADAEDTLLQQADIKADIDTESVKEKHAVETTANHLAFNGETTGDARESKEKVSGVKIIASADKEFSVVSLHQGEEHANRKTPKKDYSDQGIISWKIGGQTEIEKGKRLQNSSASNSVEITGKQDKEAKTVSDSPAVHHDDSNQTDVNAMKKEYLAALNKQHVQIRSLTKENKKVKLLLKKASCEENPLIKTLEEEIKQLRLQTDEMDNEKSALKGLIRSTMLQKDKFGQQVDCLEQELKNFRAENKKLKIDLEAMVSELNNQRSKDSDYYQALDEKDCQIKSLKQELQSLKILLEERNQQRKKDEHHAKSLKAEKKKLVRRIRDLEKKLQTSSSESKVFEKELQAVNFSVSKRSSRKEFKCKETELVNMQDVTKSSAIQCATKREEEQLGDEISFMWKSLHERQANRRQLEKQANQLQKELLVFTKVEDSTDQGVDNAQGDKEMPGIWELFDKKNARIDALKRDLEEKEQHVSKINASLGDKVAKIKQLQTDLDDATMEKSKLLQINKGMIRDLEQAKRTAAEATQFKNYYMQKVLDEVASLDDQVSFGDDEKEIKQPLSEERKEVNNVSSFMIRLKRDIRRLSVSVQEKDNKLQKGRISSFFKERELRDVKCKLGEAKNMLQEWKTLSRDRERSLKEVNHSFEENAKILEAMSRQQRKDLRNLRATAKTKDDELKRVRNALEKSRKEVENVKSLLAEKEGLIAGLEKKLNDIEYIAHKMNGKLRKKMEGKKVILILKELDDVKRENMKLSLKNADIEKRLKEMEAKGSEDHNDFIKKINNALEHVRLQRKQIRLLNGKLEESRNDELCDRDSLKKTSGATCKEEDHTPHNECVIPKSGHNKNN